MEHLIFDHNGEKYIQFGKYIEFLGYVKENWSRLAADCKTLGFVRLRTKENHGGRKPALHFLLSDIDAINSWINNKLRTTKSITLRRKVKLGYRVCSHCGLEFKVNNTSGYSRKFCSDACAFDSKKKSLDTTCVVCGKKYHVKPSHLKKIKNPTCSRHCRSEFIKINYRGSNNPNFKNKNTNSDGYRLVASDNIKDEIDEQLLHKAICCEVLQLRKIRGGSFIHIHHRDCDVLNNSACNLVLMSSSDHKWLHKQFGNATLWAYINGKVSLDELASWSDDQDRAKRLLPVSVLNQKAEDFGTIIDGVLYAKDESQTN